MAKLHRTESLAELSRSTRPFRPISDGLSSQASEVVRRHLNICVILCGGINEDCLRCGERAAKAQSGHASRILQNRTTHFLSQSVSP